MSSSYRERVACALEACKSIDDIISVEEAIKKTPHINRRTVKGRDFTQELLSLCFEKSEQLIQAGELPFL